MTARKILAAPLLVGALSLAACGGGGSGGDDTDPGADQPSLSANTSVDVNAQDRGTLAQGGSVRLAIGDLATNWNPLHVDGNNADYSEVRSPILPSYFNFDDKGVPTPNPDFLLSAEQTKASPTVVQLKLNPKAVWNDGSPVDVDDLIANWKACNGENTKNNCASTDGFDQIASITSGADKFDVTVTFKKAFPDWAQPLTQPVKAESIKDPDVFNTGWKTLNNDWLSGPFKVQSIDKTQQVVTEVPNEKWWGDKPLLDSISFRVIAVDATPNAFVNNELDAYDIGSDPNGYKLASGVADATIRKAAGPNWRHITVNSKAGVLTDKVVRQAIVQALDRDAIGASDLAGIDWPTTVLNNDIILSNQEGYQDMAELTGIKYDPEKAKADLEAAGWKAGPDGIREKDGKKLAVKFSALVGVPAAQNEALQTQNQLKDIGMKVDIVQVPVDKFNSTLSGHSFELIPFSWIGTPFPFANINQLFGTGSDSNYAQLSMPEVDKLSEQIKTETDKAKRIELANQAAKIIWENVHTIPLYQRPELIATKSKLANYGAFGLTDVQWQNVGYQK
ncbi:MAG: ABC transporter family substrate-binding protein [Friedmanniella sp.]